MARTSRVHKKQPERAEVTKEPIEKIYHVALYVRLSLLDSGHKDSDTAETQELLLRKFIEGKTYFSLFDVYVDDTAIIGLNQKTLNLRGLPIKSYFFTLFTHSHLPRGEILSKKP